MTTKATQLNKLIDAIPGVCSGGREGIRNLVAYITEEELTTSSFKAKLGDWLKFNGNTYILAGIGSDGTLLVAVNLENGHRAAASFTVKNPERLSVAEVTRALGSTHHHPIKAGDFIILRKNS